MSRPGQRALDSLREWARRTGHEVGVATSPVTVVVVSHGFTIDAAAWSPTLQEAVQAANNKLRAAGKRFVRRGGAPKGNTNASAANRRAAAKRRAA